MAGAAESTTTTTKNTNKVTNHVDYTVEIVNDYDGNSLGLNASYLNGKESSYFVTADSLSNYATKTDLATKQDAGNYFTYTQNSVTVAGVSKTLSRISPTAIFVPNGLVMGGTAGEAGLVTRGICGASTPNSTTGACSKDTLFINYDKNDNYSRKVVLGAGTVGTAITGGAYTYCAVRGDQMTSYVTSVLGSYVPTSRTVNGHALSSDITVSKSDVGLGSVANTGDSDTPVSGGTTKFTTGGAYTLQTAINNKYTKPSTGIPASDLADTYVVANSAITAGTGTKITYDAKGLVKSSTSLSASDIPSLDASKITSGTFADARIASASTWNAKQAALVSGTNIKTINGTSILGSGNITTASTSTDITNESNLSGTTITDVLNNVSNMRVTTPLTMDITTAGAVTLGLDTSAIVTQSNYDTDMLTINHQIADLDENKQDTLVSGTNIKTINGTSILGSGNISISGGSLPDKTLANMYSSGNYLYFYTYKTSGDAYSSKSSLLMKYNYTKATQSSNSVNYGSTNSSWTYKTSLSGGSTGTGILGVVYNIKYKASSNYGGVGINTSTSSFSETSSGNKGISTSYGSCWGTLTVFVPAGSTFYMWTQMTSYIYYNYVTLTNDSAYCTPTVTTPSA